jgi:uncharacterized membrane protein
MGSLLLLPLAAWMAYREGVQISFYLLLTASLVYVVGVFGVTMFGNVPLNNLLDRFDISNASADAIHAMRQKFEPKWNTLHHVRTWAAILAFVMAIISLIRR